MAFMHDFYTQEDILLAEKLPACSFLAETVEPVDLPVEKTVIQRSGEPFVFLHESAIIEFEGVLYASWYNNLEDELSGYTPIAERRSYDGGKTWTDLQIICEDKEEKIKYCPPVYGICDGNLYMLVNQMVGPDRMHALDLYVLNRETDKFELLWSRPIPFKLNTNVVKLPNGKLMLPGRIAEMDGFPNTPAVLISDDGKIDSQWRLVKIAENGDLPDGKKLRNPELTVIIEKDTLYMFSRNDERRVPLVYVSGDMGETWSEVHSHDIPYVSSKIYAGNLSDGRKYMIANVEEFDRSKLVLYLTEPGKEKFSKQLVLFDKRTCGLDNAEACHYPAACEWNGKLWIIASINYAWLKRGAVVFAVDL